ncbi:MULTISPECIES: N-formylglutamate deformylase [unclassified Azospirillum]|uniref:N-formylglutamate deformylase n=1 Tax=unclassified Azospirillum TaxID=2630922 RepID=UPI000B762AAD|nr:MULTISPECIES: N-formylglutamate deformylase [unclassified Azospirillum]SNS65868.1 formiminoglutamase [Azospirillum sp. RU38E]SNS84185.1 formiminoglutamase [Azospirillum sp. RU37A]
MPHTHPWLDITRGAAPLILSIPHAGTDIPDDIAPALADPWLARKDADWHVGALYAFAVDLGATIIRTRISRTVIDMNRPPDGASLYPGQATTDLCPLTSFDGEPLYRPGQEPDAAEVTRRRTLYHTRYHAALATEIARLRTHHARVVLYDCHSIRSRVPRLFDGDLPHFNIGTNSGASCAPALQAAVERACDVTQFSRISNGRFKGGYITRHYGQPANGVHGVQMELACRGYLAEPAWPLDVTNWPPAFDPTYAAPMVSALTHILTICRDWALEGDRT